MAYQKQTWVDGVTPLNAEHLNHMEQGISQLSTGEPGADGKSAYAYAVEGGYTGTEAEFAAKLAQEKFANPYTLTFAGAVTGSYDGSEAVTVEIPSGGSGGSSTFMIDTTTEEVSTLSWTLPVTWGKILILNIHVSVPKQDSDMDLYGIFGGSYKSIGTLAATYKNGVDIYLLKMTASTMGLGQNVVKSYPENAKPAMPSTGVNPDAGSNKLTLYSNTSGINFPTGTIFKIWGVYAP